MGRILRQRYNADEGCADHGRKAYHRAAYWEERVKMAAWWAGELDRLQGGNVVSMQQKA